MNSLIKINGKKDNEKKNNRENLAEVSKKTRKTEEGIKEDVPLDIKSEGLKFIYTYTENQKKN